MTTFQFIGAREKLTAIPEAAGRLHSFEVDNKCYSSGKPTREVINF